MNRLSETTCKISTSQAEAERFQFLSHHFIQTMALLRRSAFLKAIVFYYTFCLVTNQ